MDEREEEIRQRTSSTEVEVGENMETSIAEENATKSKTRKKTIIYKEISDISSSSEEEEEEWEHCREYNVAHVNGIRKLNGVVQLLIEWETDEEDGYRLTWEDAREGSCPRKIRAFIEEVVRKREKEMGIRVWREGLRRKRRIMRGMKYHMIEGRGGGRGKRTTTRRKKTTTQGNKEGSERSHFYRVWGRLQKVEKSFCTWIKSRFSNGGSVSIRRLGRWREIRKSGTLQGICAKSEGNGTNDSHKKIRETREKWGPVAKWNKDKLTIGKGKIDGGGLFAFGAVWDVNRNRVTRIVGCRWAEKWVEKWGQLHRTHLDR
jgi:hypothetical protein